MSTVQSIDRAFQILKELSEKAGGITDLSRRVGLPTSTVARLLSALEESDVIERVAGGYEYKLGPRILQMATQSNQNETLLSMARPHMVNLVEKLYENAGLSVISGYEVQYLGQVNCANPVQIRDWTGRRLPMHVVPSGLVSLAHLPIETVQMFLDVGALKSFLRELILLQPRFFQKIEMLLEHCIFMVQVIGFRIKRRKR